MARPGMVPGSTSNDVSGPSGIVKAVATLRALHPAVASKEVTTHAQGKTVGLILAHKFWKRNIILVLIIDFATYYNKYQLVVPGYLGG